MDRAEANGGSRRLDDPMRRISPPEPEQLSQDRAVGLQAALLVIRVRAALLAEQEARAQDGSDGASIERRAHTIAIDDPSGRQDQGTRQERADVVRELAFSRRAATL